jgi:hypothetical protein
VRAVERAWQGFYRCSSKRGVLELRLADLVVARPEPANHASLLLVGLVGCRGLDRDFDGATLVREAGVGALGELTAPEPLEPAPLLKVPRQRVVEPRDA